MKKHKGDEINLSFLFADPDDDMFEESYEAADANEEIIFPEFEAPPLEYEELVEETPFFSISDSFEPVEENAHTDDEPAIATSASDAIQQQVEPVEEVPHSTNLPLPPSEPIFRLRSHHRSHHRKDHFSRIKEREQK